MKLGDIYTFVVREGMAADLRSSNQIKKKLLEAKRTFKELKGLQKKFFDIESLSNPYADTRILHGAKKINVKRILVGIDIEVGEILLVDRLNQKGKKIDLVLAHHPEGVALAGLDDVMGLQTDLLSQIGLDYKIAKDFMDKRIKQVGRRLHGANHARAVDAARLLDLPLMCCHTPSDNHVVLYLQRLMDRKKLKTVQQIVDLLLKVPEYQEASRNKAGPRILVGKPENKAGKVMVDMTGGTEGSKEIFGRLSQAGIGTLLCMHLSEDHYNKVESEHINVIVAGHISSDNLGINLLLDKLQKRDRFEIIECSGFKRIKR